VIVLLLALIVAGAVWFFVAEKETNDLKFYPNIGNQTLIRVNTRDVESVRSYVRNIDNLLRRNHVDLPHMSAIFHDDYFQPTTSQVRTSTKAATSTIPRLRERLAMLTSLDSIPARESTATVTIEDHHVFS
jgi:hypothetical protein